MGIREDILETLSKVTDPISGRDIVSIEMLKALNIESDTVRFVIEIDPKHSEAMEKVRAQAEQRVLALPGIRKVSALLTAHQSNAPPDLKPKPRVAAKGPQRVVGVDRIVAIASGKGGVGKSTVSVNLACALAAEGRRVGLLDADVYGPSLPQMLGVNERPSSPDGKLIIPLQGYGVTMMSLGLMTKADQAVVWRGPMLMSALQQMMNQVQWGQLDILLVDLPPGTGDVQLTLTQKYCVDGAIVVSTPQDVALLDARKGINMFHQMKTPLIGLIENMSTHICSNCGYEEHVFGHGGVAKEADKLGVPLLAEIPLHIDIRAASDSGTPAVASQPDSPHTQVFRDMARKLILDGRA